MQRAIALMVAAWIMAAPTAKHAATQKPSAHQILAKMVQTYAACKSYKDTGTVSTTTAGYSSEVKFSTAFERPGRFRFEYTSDMAGMGGNHMVIWTEEDTVRTWWTIDHQVKTEESLDMAIAGATGVSSCSAHTIPRLLMPTEITGWALSDGENPKLIGRERIGNVQCDKIACIGPNKSSHIIWIGQADHLVYRIRTSMSAQSYHFVTTTDYKPQLNAKLTEADFRGVQEKQATPRHP